MKTYKMGKTGDTFWANVSTPNNGAVHIEAPINVGVTEFFDVTTRIASEEFSREEVK